MNVADQRGNVPCIRVIDMGRLLGMLAGLMMACAPQANAANIFELNFGLSGPRHDALVPLFDYPVVLGEIHSKFGHKETEYWASNLEIVAIDRIREVAFRPWRGPPQTIPRRFCTGIARVSDGTIHAMHKTGLETSG